MVNGTTLFNRSKYYLSLGSCIVYLLTSPKRRRRLRNGILLAFVPAFLFLPATAFLTVCPPDYGPTAMKDLAVGFILSELCALWNLCHLIPAKPGEGHIRAAALAGIVVAVFVLAITSWALT